MTWNLNTHVFTQCSTCSLYHFLQEMTSVIRYCVYRILAGPQDGTSDSGPVVVASWRSHRDSVMTLAVGPYPVRIASSCVMLFKKGLASAVRGNLVNSGRSVIPCSNFGLKQAILGSSMASSVSQGNTAEEGWSYSDALGWSLAQSSASILSPKFFLIFSVAPVKCSLPCTFYNFWRLNLSTWKVCVVYLITVSLSLNFATTR